MPQRPTHLPELGELCLQALAITTHLARITQHRPLARITDAGARQEAAQVRTWFAEVFRTAGDDQHDQLD